MAAGTVTIKVGTSSLIHEETQSLATKNIENLVECVASLRKRGYRVVIVTSGAVGMGCHRLGFENRPTSLAQKQAAAAVGQCRLMRIYDELFSNYGLGVGQVLLTRRDLENKSSFRNALNTFEALFRMGVVPIVNENDTIAIEELRFRDNDTLSALVATLIDSDWLFLLTDIDRLYTANPRIDPEARPIEVVEDQNDLNIDLDGGGSQWGTGGMATKLTAARIATAVGIKTVISLGSKPGAIMKALEGDRVGTLFAPKELPKAMRARKRWIISLRCHGQITVDDMAAQAVSAKRKSLFAAGIVGMEGSFEANDPVVVVNRQGVEVARGLCNFSSSDLEKIRGRQSCEIEDILGCVGFSEVIHRSNLVVM